MNTNEIVLAIDAEIIRLQHVKELLTATEAPTKGKPGRPSVVAAIAKATGFNPAELAEKPAKRRTMSAEGRAKIAAAQKARWAKSKRAAKKAAREAASAPVKKTSSTRAVARKTAPAKKAAAKKPAQSTAATAATPAS